MNVQIQNNYNYFSKYSPKTSNISLINYNNVLTFEGKRDRDSFEKKNNQPLERKAKSKMAEWAEKVALSVYGWSEKLSGKKKGGTDNKIDQAKIIRDLTRNLNRANEKIENLTKKTNNKDEKINELNDKIEDLNQRIAGYQKKNYDLMFSERELKRAIEAHERGEINPVKRAEILDNAANNDLNYNPLTPYVVETQSMYNPNQYGDTYENIKTGTTNRAAIQKIFIPEIKSDGNFDFELPKGEMKIKKTGLKKFDEPFEIQSNISEKYSDSLVWNNDKVSRDLLQNFFDGHGQTLDGVRFKFTPNDDSKKGKYKVRIEGKSIYNFKEAILLGESSSHGNKNAAGNYGEGLKMVTLKLLTQNKASDIKIGSGNWEITCSLKDDERLDSKLINYAVKPVENYDGNFIEFDTSDLNLLKTLRKSINRFYHSSNLHFKCPDFENDLFGIKVLYPFEKGGLYIAGQQFEYNDKFDGINGAAVFIKEKIPTDVFDVSRDRTSISRYDFEHIANWLADKTSEKEQKQVIKSTMDLIEESSAISALNNYFVLNLYNTIESRKKGAIKFPDNYLAEPLFFFDHAMKKNMEKNGYKIFPYDYEKLGMKSMTNIINKSRQHTPLIPNKTEQTKINIIKKALNDLSVLEKEHFTREELDTKIYLFNANADKESAILDYKNALAEAIIDDENTKGFWLDKTYLKKGSFAEILETALHELSHKSGGDGTKDFSYKLTDVNEIALGQIINDPKVTQNFKIYSDIWESL